MPCAALSSASLMSWVFFAVISFSSPILLLIGVTWLWTYFLVAQPTVRHQAAGDQHCHKRNSVHCIYSCKTDFNPSTHTKCTSAANWPRPFADARHTVFNHLGTGP